MPVALITGASRGLGAAFGAGLAGRGWDLIVDARDGAALTRTVEGWGDTVVAIPGDVAAPDHREELARAVQRLGRLDLLVNNASLLGPSPQPHLERYPLDVLEQVYRVNVLAPLALVQLALPSIPGGGRIVSVTSDAAVEAYEGWG